MATKLEHQFAEGDRVWLIDPAGSTWARVVEVRDEALCLETLDGQHLGSFDKTFVLPANVVSEVLNKAGASIRP